VGLVYGLEWEDVVYSYLVELYKKVGGPILPSWLANGMSRDVGERVELSRVNEALKSLEDKELIIRLGKGYVPHTKEVDFTIQLGMEKVKPFSREPGEVPESHMDKVWSGDIRDLVKPTFGNEYGLYPVVQYSVEDKVWKGLVKE
jgi:hypothetical protein